MCVMQYNKVHTVQYYNLNRHNMGKLCSLCRWQENHDIKFPGMKQMVELHHQVQNRLKSFYCHINEGSIRHQHQESRCAQLQAFCVLLNGE